MEQRLESTLKRIRRIRKAKQRSIHDCASILNISIEHYLRFEDGTAPLSLPEIEVLAQFFDVPFRSIFDHSNLESHSTKLSGATKSHYISLRHKMIQAKFNLLRDQAGFSLEHVQLKTGIPQEALQAFDTGKSPIPINNLIKIADCFGKSIGYFFETELLVKDRNESQNLNKPKWMPEYPENEIRDQYEDSYGQIIQALKQIPKEDQARIAKLLLNNLKSQ